MEIKNLLQQISAHGAEFELYFNRLIEYNSHTNLTAITEHDEVYIKHFLDSILPIEEIVLGASMVDVGTGAGFPGLPIKIVRPDVDLTLVDSLNKRINFLVELTKNLAGLRVENDNKDAGLKNKNVANKKVADCSAETNKKQLDLAVKTNADVKIFHERAEDFCLNNREKFDVAVARAVAKLNTLLEYLLPLVKVGGIVLAYKGSNWQDEVNEAQKAVEILGGKIEKVLTYNLPTNLKSTMQIGVESGNLKESKANLNENLTKQTESLGERNIIVIKKIRPTPKQYPRGQNKPKISPIV